MKLTYPSSTLCTLQIKPWGGRLFGLLFIVIGIAILFLFFMSSKITCNVKRTGIAQQCIFKETIFNLYQSTSSLGELQGAKMRRVYSPPSRNNQQGSYSYEVLLMTARVPEGHYFNALNFSNLMTAQTTVANINQFIQDGTQPTLSLPNSTPFWVWLIPILFIPTGVFLFMTSAGVQMDLNQTTQIATIRFTDLKNVRVQHIPFADIASFVVDSRLAANSSNGSSSSVGDLDDQFTQNNNQEYGLVLELKNHQRIPISQTYDNFYHHKATIADKLNQWIGRKPENTMR